MKNNYLVPSPQNSGLPAKFTSWRPGQEDAITRAAESSKRFVVLCMPTGSGKSPTYVALANLTGYRCAILTSTKALQSQLLDDFGSVGMVDMRGMGNYPCRLLVEDAKRNPEMHRLSGGHDSDIPMCDIGPCLAGTHCDYKPGRDSDLNSIEEMCSYYTAQDTAKESQLLTTNYQYWMHAQRQGLGLYHTEKILNGPNKGTLKVMNPHELLVLDEAHDASERLGDFLAVEITLFQVENLLGADWPRDFDQWDPWKEWCAEMVSVAKSRAADIAERIKLKSATRTEMKQYRELTRISTDLGRIAASEGSWVQHMRRSGPRGTLKIHFDPIWPGEFSERYLFLGIPKIVLTSATVRPKTLDLLGVPKEECEFIEFPSSFPLARRPVYHLPTIRMDKNTSQGEMQIWVAKIDNLIRARLDRKGIIHTVSYARRDYILKFSEFRHLMMSHESGTTRDRIEEFRNALAPCVFVSPSVTTGYDFPYEDCQYQIIGKIPFLDSRDEIVKARSNADPSYPMYVTMQTLVQSSGRGMRAPDDLCETFIIDDHAKWFMYKFSHFAPKWFMQSYKSVTGLPAPPPILARGKR